MEVTDKQFHIALHVQGKILIFDFGIRYPLNLLLSVQYVQRRMPHHIIRAGTQQHATLFQEDEDLCGSRVSLETSHTGGGGH